MPLSEFAIIQNYFKKISVQRQDVVVGIGDDAALLTAPRQQLVMTMDSLNVDIHFFADMPAEALGYKSLAVNLSDLAAMGAEPAWICLALSLPEVNEEWLEKFCQGFNRLLTEHQVQLIGGDTCRGALSCTVHATGFVDPDLALRRDKAQVGDLIYVSHSLGAAGLALEALKGKIMLSSADFEKVLAHLYYPTPRFEIARSLRGIAKTAIDLSDGLAGDLAHILKASKVGAVLYADKVPIAPTVLKYYSFKDALTLALTAGDDYELCFTIPATAQAIVEKNLGTHCSLIGKITAELDYLLEDAEGVCQPLVLCAHQHFQ